MRKEEVAELSQQVAVRNHKIAELERKLAVEKAKVEQLEGFVRESRLPFGNQAPAW
jgi:predicted RNase H-like nuclease (RuvC/YqgF family)